MREFTTRESAFIYVIILLFIQSGVWWYKTNDTYMKAYAQHKCVEHALIETQHGHNKLAYTYMKSASRAYYTGECALDSHMEIVLHPLDHPDGVPH